MTSPLLNRVTPKDTIETWRQKTNEIVDRLKDLYPHVDNNLYVENDAFIKGHLTIDGNLEIKGDTTTVNTTELNIEDNTILLNSNLTGTPPNLLESGIEVNRGSSSNKRFYWDEATLKWIIEGDLDVSGDINNSSFQWVLDSNTNHISNLNTGNVSIGTSTATSHKLTVLGDLGVGDSLSGSNLDGIVFSSTSTSGYHNTIKHTDNGLEFDNTASVQRDYSFLGGNVGIGTTSPSAKLDIISDITGTSTEDLRITNSTVTNQWHRGIAVLHPNISNTNSGLIMFGNAESTGDSGHISFKNSATDGEEQIQIGIFNKNNLLNIQGNGNVGIGTTSPNEKLHVNGGNLTVSSGGISSSHGFASSQSSLFIAQPGGAVLNSSISPHTGSIKIQLPQSWTNTMMTMQIRVFDYSSDESFDIFCGGYNYTGTGGGWYNTFAYILTSPFEWRNFPVRFTHDGSKCCIFIGDTNQVWNYPKFNVINFTANHTADDWDKWRDGWNISIETTIPTYSNDNHSALLHEHMTTRHSPWIVDKTTGHIYNNWTGSRNFGIGISAPAEKLEVSGAIKLGTTTNNNSGTIRYNTTTNDFEGNTDGTSGGWTSLTNSNTNLWSAGTTSGDIHYSSGNVGIGTNNPSSRLEVLTSGSISAFNAGKQNTSTGTDSVAIGRYNNATGNYSSAIGLNNDATGYASFSCGESNESSGNGCFSSGAFSKAQGNYTTAMGIKMTVVGNYSFGIGLDNTARTFSQASTMAIMGGKVGIGTVTPSTELEVTGTIRASNLTGDRVLVSNSTKDIISSSVTTTELGYLAGVTSGIQTQIDNAGKWDDQASSGDVYRNSNVGIGNFSSTALTEKLEVDGNISATGTIQSTSDITLKENLEIIENPIEKIKELNGYTYNMIGKEDRHAGLVAQEVEKVLPEVVRETMNGTKSLAYGNIVALLVETVKEQQKQIDELKKLISDK